MPGARDRPLVTVTAAGVILGLVLAGCGGDKKVDSGATTTTAVESGSGEEDKEANTVAIDMKDYAFAVVGDVKAGTTTVALQNSGTELHMAAFGRLKEGKGLADVQGALQSEDESAVESVYTPLDAPSAVLSPGQSQELTTDLLGAGSYAVICFIPTAGDGAPHFAKGMVTTFDVAAGAVEATAPDADARYTIDDGTIEGPTTLKTGENTLQMTSAGTGPHEFFVVRKREPDTTYADVDAFFDELFEGDTPPPKGYSDTAPGIIVANTSDLMPGNTIFLVTDLEPGDYMVGCAREGDTTGGQPAKQHTGEILDVTVT